MATEETSKPTYVRKVKGKVNNTCGNSSKMKRLTRQLAGIMAHLEQHPRDTLSQNRVSTINILLRQ
jgi:ribosomal protein S15P/S13E